MKDARRTATPVRSAVDRALTFLARLQEPNGEYLVRLGRALTRTERILWLGKGPLPVQLSTGMDMRSIFGTAMVARAVARYAGRADADTIVRKARRFLLSEREPGGVWRYFGTGNPKPPPDVDDTAYALLALPRRPGDAKSIRSILTNKVPSGAVHTWLAMNSRHRLPVTVDGCVNANVLTAFRSRGFSDEGIARYVERVLVRRRFTRGTPFYPSPFFFLYAAAGAKDGLSPACVARVEKELRRRWKSAVRGPVLDAALACAGLASLGHPDPTARDRLLKRILSLQAADGGWAPIPIFRAPFWFGSRATTTAVCLDALSAEAP